MSNVLSGGQAEAGTRGSTPAPGPLVKSRAHRDYLWSGFQHPSCQSVPALYAVVERAASPDARWMYMDSTISDLDAASLAATLQCVASGDRAAFEEVYRRTSVKLFGVCLRILPIRQEAEEALQEAYLSVWQKAGSFDTTRGSAMTWLITLTRNRAIDCLRAAGKFTAAPIELAEDVVDPAPPASRILEMGEDERRLASCLDTLEGGEAMLIRTAFLEGSTYAELASRASTPLGTIKSRIRRALLKLQECLR